jgi:hypothetical protein
MATTRTAPGVTTRGRQPPPIEDDEAVSPARWLGVALVVGALVTAMVMAMTSRVEPGTGSTSAGDVGAAIAPTATETPLPVASGEGVPTELPMVDLTSDHVSDPLVGNVTRDRDATLAITVPETHLRTRDLTLLVLHDGEVVQAIKKPSDTEDPHPIALEEGPNRLTARLAGPNGAGPAATDIEILLDTQPPTLSVDAPRDHQPVEGDRVTVRGASDPGTTISIVNRRTGAESPLTVGPSGEFEEVVLLEPGENELRIKASDVAGNVESLVRSVDRAGAGVKPKISVTPGQLSARQLPRSVRVIARMHDKEKRPVKGARVTFTLSVPGQATARSKEVVTGADGTAVWKVEIPSEGIETGDAQVTLVAQLPTGARVGADSVRALTIVR